MPLNIPPPFNSFADIIAGLQDLINQFIAAEDERGVFATAYLTLTQRLKAESAAATFADPAWVEQCAIAFSNLYRQALTQGEANDPTLPKAWQFSFDAASNHSALVFQDLLLGINAHINHDLAFALQQVGIDPNRDAKHADFTLVNQVLSDAIIPVEKSVADEYARGLGILARAFDPFDADFVNFSIDNAREQAWRNGVLLVDAGSPEAQAAAADTINSFAAALARVILAPTTDIPFLLPLLRHFEQGKSWHDFL